MSDETIIYSADVRPSVSVGMPEVQAHAMSCPQIAYNASSSDDQIRQIQDDIERSIEMACGVQEQEPVDDLTAARNEIQRLSAELTHRTQVWEGEEFKLRGELSDARAEVERLSKAWDVAYQLAMDNGSRALSLHLENERLRKEREDEGARSGNDVASVLCSISADSQLNPRLGLPQPDGDPVAPMSAKKPYRWGAL